MTTLFCFFTIYVLFFLLWFKYIDVKLQKRHFYYIKGKTKNKKTKDLPTTLIKEDCCRALQAAELLAYSFSLSLVVLRYTLKQVPLPPMYYE